MKPYIAVLITACLTATPCVCAQSTMSVESITVSGDNASPVLDNERKPMARIEIETPIPMPDLEVVATGLVRPDSAQAYGDNRHFVAHAASARMYSAKEMSLTNPGFKKLNIVFGDYLPEKKLDPAKTYQVKIYVPSAQLVEADKAYDALDFDRAERLYLAIEEPENDRNLAQQHLSTLREMRPILNQLSTLENSTDKIKLYKALNGYDAIYQRTKSSTALHKYRELEKKLFGGKRRARTFKYAPISDLKVASITAKPESSVEAKTHLSGDGLGERALLLIDKLPLEKIKVKSAKDALRVYTDTVTQELLVWLTPDAAGAATEIVLTQPDCRPLRFSAKDFGINELKKNITYQVTLQAPTYDMMEANRHFTQMFFEDAIPLYAQIAEDSIGHPEEERDLAAQRATFCANVDDDVEDIRRLRALMNKGGIVMEREDLCNMADSIIYLAQRFAEAGVEGAKSLEKHYENEKIKYRDCYQLILRPKVLVKAKNGQKETPLDEKEIEVRILSAGDYKPQTVNMTPGKPGTYTMFLSQEASRKIQTSGYVSGEVSYYDVSGKKAEKRIHEFELKKDGNKLNMVYDFIF